MPNIFHPKNKSNQKDKPNVLQDSSNGILTDEQFEWLELVQEYKMKTGNKFPSYTQLLELFKTAGYEKTKTR